MITAMEAIRLAEQAQEANYYEAFEFTNSRVRESSRRGE